MRYLPRQPFKDRMDAIQGLNIRGASSIKDDDSRWGAVGAEAHLDGLILVRFCPEINSIGATSNGE